MKCLLKALPALVFVFYLSGCSTLFQGRDNEEDSYGKEPVAGGLWSEGGQLNNDDRPSQTESVYSDRNSLASDRAPASNADQYGGAPAPVFGADDENANLGDEQMHARAPSVGNTPNLPPSVKRNYKNGSRATRADFVDSEANDGSLWGANGQTNYYFSKNKVRSIGDIITVNLESNIIKDTALEIRRTLNEKEREVELEAARDRINGVSGDKKKDSIATSAAAPERKPADASASNDGGDAVVQNKKVTLADIDVTSSMGIKEGETMMAEITERYPNGNYKIRGTKRVPYRTGSRMVHVVAIARGQDVSDDDLIASGKLYEYRVEAVR